MTLLGALKNGMAMRVIGNQCLAASASASQVVLVAVYHLPQSASTKMRDTLAVAPPEVSTYAVSRLYWLGVALAVRLMH